MAEEIIRETCKELDIEIIDMAMNVTHVPLFIKYPPKYSASWIDRLNQDFRTICRFRMENLDIIKWVIAEIAKLAREMGMVKLGHLSIDGTKIKASASNFSVVSNSP